MNLKTVQKKPLQDHLAFFQKNHKPGSYRMHCVVIKHVLKLIGRKKLAKEIVLPKRPDSAGAINLIPAEDRQKLIQEAPTLQDRLIIELMDETGGRRGEIYKLRIKDVQFDEYGAILWLNGKTGVRRRRVYGAVADLRSQINNNSKRSDPEAALFYKPDGSSFTSLQFYRHVKKMGWRILKKNIHPHMFRHSRATEDFRYFTDREMIKLFGWKRPEQVSVYSHLSMRDVEEKDLVLHGLKPREEILPGYSRRSCKGYL